MKKIIYPILFLTVFSFLFGFASSNTEAQTNYTIRELLQIIESIQKQIADLRVRLAKLESESIWHSSNGSWGDRFSLVEAFDFNNDGVFDSNDVGRLKEAISDETLRVEGMDLNGDGAIDMEDVTLLQNICHDFNSYHLADKVDLLELLNPKAAAAVVLAVYAEDHWGEGQEEAAELIGAMNSDTGAQILIAFREFNSFFSGQYGHANQAARLLINIALDEKIAEILTLIMEKEEIDYAGSILGEIAHHGNMVIAAETLMCMEIDYAIEIMKVDKFTPQRSPEEASIIFIAMLELEGGLERTSIILSEMEASTSAQVIVIMAITVRAEKMAEIIRLMQSVNVASIFNEIVISAEFAADILEALEDKEKVNSILGALDVLNPKKANQIRELLGLSYKCGDITDDGAVDMADVILLMNYVGNNEKYVIFSEWAADVNCDGVINMGDVILLLNHVGYPGKYQLNCCFESSITVISPGNILIENQLASLINAVSGPIEQLRNLIRR